MTSSRTSSKGTSASSTLSSFWPAGANDPSASSSQSAARPRRISGSSCRQAPGVAPEAVPLRAPCRASTRSVATRAGAQRRSRRHARRLQPDRLRGARTASTGTARRPSPQGAPRRADRRPRWSRNGRPLSVPATGAGAGARGKSPVANMCSRTRSACECRAIQQRCQPLRRCHHGRARRAAFRRGRTDPRRSAARTGMSAAGHRSGHPGARHPALDRRVQPAGGVQLSCGRHRRRRSAFSRRRPS